MPTPNKEETKAPSSAIEKKGNRVSEFFSAHKGTIAKVAALVLGSAATFAAVFFTAGTTLPFIVATAAKVGLDLGFLSTLGTLAASAAATGLLTGAVAAISTSIYALFTGVSALKNYFSSKTEAKNEAPAKNSGEENAPEVEGSTKGMTADLGGANKAPEAKPEAAADANETAQQEEKAPEAVKEDAAERRFVMA